MALHLDKHRGVTFELVMSTPYATVNLYPGALLHCHIACTLLNVNEDKLVDNLSNIAKIVTKDI